MVHRAAGETLSPHVGNEIDVTIRVPFGGVGLEAGYGRFFGGAYLRDAGFAQRTADFLYVQTTLGL